MATRKLSAKDKLIQYTVDNVKGLVDRDKKSEGAGSYGTVYRVTVNGVPRIAKQLHEMLVNSLVVGHNEKDSILESFYRECLILSKLYHPNVVEFIGVHFGQDNEISLIMEHVFTDLDKFIDKKRHPVIPLSIKASILLDVSYGLLYLHSMKPEPIIHRDLTTRNILLTRDFRAKIADLGVAKILKIEPNSATNQTECPGTQAYMPPEALRRNPKYGTELDMFSFGHLLLCVAIQDAAQVYDISDCDPVTLIDHVERNQIHILKRKEWIDSLKNPDSCLRELIISCLNDKPEARPTAKDTSDVIKIICDRFPKTPTDFISVWDNCEIGVLEKCVSPDMQTIQLLCNQLEETKAAKEALQIEKASLAQEKARNETVFAGLKISHTSVASELFAMTEDLRQTQEELSLTREKLRECEIDLVKESTDHDLTRAAMYETKDLSNRIIADLQHVIQQKDHFIDTLLSEHDTMVTQEDKCQSNRKYPTMKRNRSKSDVSEHKNKNENLKENPLQTHLGTQAQKLSRSVDDLKNLSDTKKEKSRMTWRFKLGASKFRTKKKVFRRSADDQLELKTKEARFKDMSDGTSHSLFEGFQTRALKRSSGTSLLNADNTENS